MFKKRRSIKLVAAVLLCAIVLAQAGDALARGRHGRHRHRHRRAHYYSHYYLPPVLGGLALLYCYSHARRKPEKTYVIIKEKEDEKDDCSCSHSRSRKCR